jgi:hypothetical protein
MMKNKVRMGSIMIRNEFLAGKRAEDLQDSNQTRDQHLVSSRGRLLIDDMVALARNLSCLIMYKRNLCY